MTRPERTPFSWHCVHHKSQQALAAHRLVHLFAAIADHYAIAETQFVDCQAPDGLSGQWYAQAQFESFSYILSEQVC